MENTTSKLSVNEISKTLFVIPYYQRGYRWTAKNATQLLDDLDEFYQTGETEYCLQPIVLQEINSTDYTEIAKGKKVMRVVDGQQRLTTIAIILSCLGLIQKWDIYYDSEKDTLSKILTKENNTINDHFRNSVIKAVEECGQGKKEKIKKLFDSKSKKHVVFLRYDIPDNGDGHETFLRLNDGKTPLTSSELIRAMYMVRSSGLSSQQQMEISKEWEIIDNALRNNQFWLMFNAQGLDDTPTRIDLLFALALGVNLKDAKANPIIVFEKLDDKNLENEWEKVLRIFWWMQSCYLDIELFNYLCWVNLFTENSAKTIYDTWLKFPRINDFKNSIINLIQKVNLSGNQITNLESVNYDWDKGELRKLFVLLNVLDCNHSKERFRFDLYKDKSWDIEHINSQTPNELKEYNNKIEWLKTSFNELSDDQKNKFCNECASLHKENIAFKDDQEFNTFASKIIELTNGSIDEQIPDDKNNSLGNLALLNSSINRSYHNDIFPLKRKKIIEAVDDFIPPCTTKAFTKFYTKSASKITSWLKADYEDYYDTMNALFNEFMNLETTEIQEQPTVNSSAEKSKSFTHIQDNQSDKENPKPDRLNGEVNFIDFMDKYNVIIPKIQRLYVQGRNDKHGNKCLTGFASSLVESATNKTPLLLDFVYGIDANTTSKPDFYPLDGQQRLTTLLLLSWLCGVSKSDWSFKYESRRTAEVFITSLLGSTPPELKKPNDYENRKKNTKEDYLPLCSEYIRQSTWFQTTWEADAGISGMLEMLDSLYDKLLQHNATKETLDANMSKIVFLLNYLDTDKRSYDQIFLKMNSRGRELTEWDNVKAVLDKNYPEKENKSDWQNNVQSWYESMWEKFNVKNIDTVDAKMLNIVELALDCAGYKKKVSNTFELSKWLEDAKNSEETEKFYSYCRTFFSALEIETNIVSVLAPHWNVKRSPRKPDFATNDKVVEDFYKPLLAYYCAKKSTDSEWMRVAWNLIENISLERSSFSQAIHLIDELSEHSNSIIEFLSDISDINKGIKSNYKNANDQLQEEIDKAKQISKNGTNYPSDWDESVLGQWKDWQTAIQTAESHPYFAGSIRFLYQSGDENEPIDWDSFCTKWQNANTYFTNDGIKEEYAASLIGTLIKRCTQWNQLRERYIFDRTTWKNEVLTDPIYIAPLNDILSIKYLNEIKLATFEDRLICEKNIRDTIADNDLMKKITSDYCNYRLKDGGWFYKWHGADGILFDWATNEENPENWERRRNRQLYEIKKTPNLEIEITSDSITDVFYYGFYLYFKYKEHIFVWKSNSEIDIQNGDNWDTILTVSPDKTGNDIINKLNEYIDKLPTAEGNI